MKPAPARSAQSLDSSPSLAAPSAAALSGRIGPDLVLRFAAALRTATTHGVENQAFRQHAQAFLTAAAPLLCQGELTLASTADHLHVNGVRVLASSVHLAIHRKLMADFRRSGIGGFVFLQMPEPAEFSRAIRLLLSWAVEEAPADSSLKLREEGVESIRVLDPVVLEAPTGTGENTIATAGEDPESQERRMARIAHQAAVDGVRLLFRQTRRDRQSDLRKGQRIVQPLVDFVIRHQYSIVGLTALKKHDNYTYAHCVNVAILAIASGQVLGLNRSELADLGVAALLHDVGKTDVPPEILRKPGGLDEAEWAAIQAHPLAGARLIARIPGLSFLMLDAMQVCLEHHIGIDGSGYPAGRQTPAPSAAARIVAVVDCYDALTAHRAYRKRPFSPVQALDQIRSLSGSRFDGAAIRALVLAVGHYPAGSWVETGSGKIALVVSPDPRDPRRPNCIVVRADQSSAGAEPIVEEVWSPMPNRENVVRVLEPVEYPAEPEEYLAA